MKRNSIPPQSSFDTIKRDRLLNYATYSSEADHLMVRIPRAEQRLSDAEWLADKDTGQLMMLTWVRAGYAIDLIALQYSAGAPRS
jgi:hypothetical protein